MRPFFYLLHIGKLLLSRAHLPCETHLHIASQKSLMEQWQRAQEQDEGEKAGGFQCFRALSSHAWRKILLPAILHPLGSNTARVVLGQLPALPSNWNPLQKIPSCPAQTGTVTLVSDSQDSHCTKTARPICPCFTLLLGLLFATFFGAGTWRAPLEGPQVVWRSLSYICHPLELKYNEIYK